MNNLATIAEPVAVRYSPRCFYPYRVTESGRTYALVVDCSTLVEAVERGKVHCQHKEHLLIRETDERGSRLHLYAIKRKSAARYVHKDHVTRAVHDLYAAPVCIVDEGMLGR